MHTHRQIDQLVYELYGNEFAEISAKRVTSMKYKELIVFEISEVVVS